MLKKKKSYIKIISAIYRYSQGCIGEKIKGYNIGKGQWFYLTQLLFNEDGLTQDELSRILYVDKANTARALNKLEEEGFVYRVEDAEDKRKNRVYVTDKSAGFKTEFHQIFKDYNKVLVAGFTDKEKEIALDLLNRMLENVIGCKDDKHV
ncbi:MAG: MarR family transcriptional regulator [Clostridia bacterium]|nr:MarR family transcriptional regulator [Clostridia bacterium]